MTMAIKHIKCHAERGDCVAMLNMWLCHSERSEESNECDMLKNKILRLKPQNDITTHSVDPESRPMLDSRFPDCVVMSLRRSETTEAILYAFDNTKIATLPSVVRNDKKNIVTQYLRGNDCSDVNYCRGNHFTGLDG